MDGTYYLYYEIDKVDKDRLIKKQYKNNCDFLDYYSNRFYVYLLQNLERMLLNGPLKTTVPTYRSWRKLDCSEVKRESHVDFWFEVSALPSVPVRYFYRLIEYGNPYGNKMDTYRLMNMSPEVNPNIPVYYSVENSTNTVNFFKGLIRKIELDVSRGKRTWLLKDANGSVGLSIFGIYVHMKDDRTIDFDRTYTGFYNGVVHYIKNIKSFGTGFRFVSYKDYIINNPSVTIERLVENEILFGFSGKPSWFVNEYVNSIKVPNQFNLIPGLTAQGWASELEGCTIKLRAYFVPIISFDPKNNYQKNIFGWLNPRLDIDFIEKNNRSLEETMSKVEYFVSNFTSGNIQNKIKRIYPVLEDFDQEVFKQVLGTEENIAHVWSQIENICRSLISNVLIECDNYRYVDYFRGKNLDFKCFNVMALDLLVSDNYTVYFLETNNSPVVQKYFQDEVYGTLYQVCIENQVRDRMIYLNAATPIQQPTTPVPTKPIQQPTEPVPTTPVQPTEPVPTTPIQQPTEPVPTTPVQQPTPIQSDKPTKTTPIQSDKSILKPAVNTTSNVAPTSFLKPAVNTTSNVAPTSFLKPAVNPTKYSPVKPSTSTSSTQSKKVGKKRRIRVIIRI